MPQLDNYLVTLGMKGQNIVLSQMDKIRKKGKDLTKKQTIPLSVKSAHGKSVPGQPTPGKPIPGQPIPGKPVPNDEKANKFNKAIDKFGRGADRFASAAATLSPSALIQSIASTLPFLGAVAAAAGGALESAKTSTAGAYELSKRNAATNFYGGNLIGGRASRGYGNLSNSEHAMFTAAVSGSMGRIQKPLADAINKLIVTKDTRALARAASGDWESTGTDKGWIASQMMSGMEGMPPSIKQKLSAAMLKNFGGEIQEAPKEQRTRQRAAANYENASENQTMRLANVAADSVKSLTALNNALNNLQVTMVTGANKMVKAIEIVTDATLSNKKQSGKLNTLLEVFK